MRHRACPAIFVSLLASFACAQSVQLVYADGRREPAAAPHQDGKGRWTVEREGRRTMLRAGEVVAIVDDKGKETVIIPELDASADTPETTALLASLRDPKNKAWEQAMEPLRERRTRSVFDALLAQSKDNRKELRLRAIAALSRLCTKESAMAVANAVLAEKDAGTRKSAASAMFAVGEVLKRCDFAATLGKGLADKDVEVRVAFAMLSPPADAAAALVLRNDGLKHSDHHVRESAATELAERGDPAGESLLLGMLSWTRVPGLEGDADFLERQLIRQQVQICAALGKLGTATAKAALTKASSSRFEAVRKAAAAALAAK
jgi:HEAT repeat protein